MGDGFIMVNDDLRKRELVTFTLAHCRPNTGFVSLLCGALHELAICKCGQDQSGPIVGWHTSSTWTRGWLLRLFLTLTCLAGRDIEWDEMNVEQARGGKKACKSVHLCLDVAGLEFVVTRGNNCASGYAVVMHTSTSPLAITCVNCL